MAKRRTKKASRRTKGGEPAIVTAAEVAGRTAGRAVAATMNVVDRVVTRGGRTRSRPTKGKKRKA